MAYNDKPTDFRQWGTSSTTQSQPVDYLAGLREYGVGETNKSGDFSTWQKLMGGTAEDGSKINSGLMTGMNVGSGLLKSYLGMKQYGLAKKEFKQNRREFNLNYDAQQQNVNSQLRDRQRNRVRGNPDAYESVSTYMDRNRVRDR